MSSDEMAEILNKVGRGTAPASFALALIAVCASAAPAAAAPDAVRGELIVGFEKPAGAARVSDALAGVATRAVRSLPLPRTKLVELRAGHGTGAAIAALGGAPGVRYAEPNYVRTLRSVPDDPEFESLWGLRSINAPSAWNVTTGSPDVAIAIADDGVQTTHPDLAPNALGGWDFAAEDGTPLPETNRNGQMSSHGTHVAGIIGARGDNGIGVTGVNWQVGIMPLRIFNRDGTTTTDRIVRAFAYAGRHGAVALNASFGGETSSRAEREAIAAWPQTLFVVAAPNERVNIDVYPDYPCVYPLENLVCVSASDRSGKLASFAAYGRETVDLVAPGAHILSTVPGGYEAMTGTSMAAPHVSGVAGLIAAAHPALGARAIRKALLASGHRTRRLKKKTASGRLDARAALHAAAG